MRRLTLIPALLLAVLWTVDVHAATPNIVLCMADDLGWGDVGFNGNEVIQTPHLDAMAAAGLKFNRFYSAAPVCSPTRGSCLTGRHPFRYGIPGANSGHMKQQEFTLPELLKEHGYATGHFGKWHLGTFTTTEKDSNRGGPKNKQHYSIPTQHGYDTFFCTEAKVPTWDPMIRPQGNNSRTWWDPVTDPSKETYYGTAYWSEQGKVTEDLRGDDSRVIMDRAIPFIRSAVERKHPFFAVVWFHAPHLPVVAGPEYTKLYTEHDKHSQHYLAASLPSTSRWAGCEVNCANSASPRTPSSHSVPITDRKGMTKLPVPPDRSVVASGASSKEAFASPASSNGRASSNRAARPTSRP